jgi:uncharacterized protein
MWIMAVSGSLPPIPAVFQQPLSKNETMRNKLLHILMLILGFVGCIEMRLSAQDHELLGKVTGTWTGALKIQGMELMLVINFSVNGQDSLTATIDSPDQGAKDIPTSSVILTKDSVIVKSKTIRGSYLGEFKENYSLLNGVWKQGGMTFPLEMRHSEKKFARNRPQEPQPPFPYIEKEVIIKNPAAGTSLSGTLTLPDEKNVYPSVILISGSGPQNRDEELLGHKPFLVLADHLTRNGIAVLRYDDRGIGKSNGDFQTATSADFATDASAAVDFLKTQPGIDTLAIGLMGHSEGGMIAPMVASERTDVGFVVLLAGPGLTGEQILNLQSALIAKADSAKQEDIDRTGKLNAKIYSILKKYPDNTKAMEKIMKEIRSYNKKYPPAEGEEPMDEKIMEVQMKTVTSTWFRYFLTFNPYDYLTKVKCPLLALNGSLDLQVPSKEDLSAIEKAMIFGGNSHYTLEEIPGVNHLFQTAKTGSPNEYAKIEETISPIVLDKITNWILHTTAK